jgi:hypothetical protein
MEPSKRTPQQKAKGNTTTKERLKLREQAEKPKIVHQAAAGAFPVASFFLPFNLSDFSFPVGQSPTFLLLLLIVDPVRRQAITLPHPGLAASKLLSTSQSSFVNKASGLRANGGGMGVELTFDRSGEHKVTDEFSLTCFH